jgi:hypothetical protein
MDNGLCASECMGYYRDPTPGHLWAGEYEAEKRPSARAEPLQPKVSLADITEAFDRAKDDE